FTTENIKIEDIGKVYTINDAAERYIKFAKESIKNSSLKGIKIVLDCANGAAYRIAPQVFMDLGADVVVFGDKPDGININRNCGTLHANVIKSAVMQHKADIGISLDGDADRVIMVDENGEVLDGDHILAVCGLYMSKNGLLKNNTIVGTVMSNFGFELFLKENGIKFVRTDVGDKYVIREMKDNNYNLGGEQAGHIIFADFNSTGDGIITALQVLNIMKESGKKLSTLDGKLVSLPQILKNIDVIEKKPIDEMGKVKDIINDIKSTLNGDGRVLVRYSGTEKKCRVMVEGKDTDRVDEYAQMIATEIKNEIGR
ncbi:MAG: phosphoglucosamine mutase, partial [Candidatus Anammoxibacter sp.]